MPRYLTVNPADRTILCADGEFRPAPEVGWVQFHHPRMFRTLRGASRLGTAYEDTVDIRIGRQKHYEFVAPAAADELHPGRPCERCGAEINDPGYPYGWCPACAESGTCRHGNPPESCEDCLFESDLAYDRSRE